MWNDPNGVFDTELTSTPHPPARCPRSIDATSLLLPVNKVFRLACEGNGYTIEVVSSDGILDHSFVLHQWATTNHWKPKQRAVTID